MAAAGIDTDVGHIDNKILEAFAERLYLSVRGRPRDRGSGPASPSTSRSSPGLLQVDAARKRVTSTTTWLLLAWMVGSSVVLVGDLDLLPAPADPADPPARQGRRQLRQGPRRRRLPAAGCAGDPPGGARLQPDAPPHPAPHQPAHRDAGGGQPRPAHAADPDAARAGAAGRRPEPGADRAAPGRRRDVQAGRGVSGLRPRRGPRERRAHRAGPMLESMRQRAERSGVALEIAMERPIILPLRPTAFHRCLGNLVDNACRYARWIGISVKQKDEMVEIAIDDDGPGIPEALREKVFEPFVRLDEQPAGENGGTGPRPDDRARRRAVAMAASCGSTGRGAAGCAPCCGCRLEPMPLQPDAPPVILASGSPARAAAAARRRRRVHRGPGAGRRGRRARRAARRGRAGRGCRRGAGRAEGRQRRRRGRPPRPIVLGADQLLELEGEWLEKPVDLRRRRAPSCCGCAAGGTGWSARWWRSAAAAGSGTMSMSRGPGPAPVLRRLPRPTIWLRPGRTSWAASAPTSSRAWARS